MWCIVVLARHSVCNLLFEIDSVVCSSAASLGVHSLPLCHLCVDSGGISQAAASVCCEILYVAAIFTREYQTWRLQHEIADYTPDNLTGGQTGTG